MSVASGYSWKARGNNETEITHMSSLVIELPLQPDQVLAARRKNSLAKSANCEVVRITPSATVKMHNHI